MGMDTMKVSLTGWTQRTNTMGCYVSMFWLNEWHVSCSDSHHVYSCYACTPGPVPLLRTVQKVCVQNMEKQYPWCKNNHGENIRGTTVLGSRGKVSKGGADYRVRTTEQEAKTRFLGSEVQRLQWQGADSSEQAVRRDSINHQLLTKMSCNIARIKAALGRCVPTAPVVPEVVATIATPQAAAPLKADLLAHPRTLHNLWAEWQFGGPGRKPAKDLNSGKQGAVKISYSFRKAFWDKVAEMVRAGYTAHVACDKIYACYGKSISVTDILRKTKADHRSGQWPDRLIVQRRL